MKRFTGLAQPRPENLTDGSWFGVDTANNYAPLIHWSQIQLVNPTSSVQNWDASIPARYETYPASTCGTVRLNNTAGVEKSFDEYNGIADVFSC